MGLCHLGASEQKTVGEPKLCSPTVMSSKLEKIKVENLRFSPFLLSFLFYLRFLAHRTLVRLSLVSRRFSL